MLRADHASVAWNAAKKRWEVRIQVGAEVMKRPIPNLASNAGSEALLPQAVAIARDEGYELDPARVVLEVPAKVA